MQSTAERICHPVSIEELERRWILTHAHMRSEKIDVLVAQGANSFSGGGYYRWLTGQSAGNYNPNTVIFPVRGLLTLIGQGPMGGEATLGTADPTAPGVGRRAFTPS